MEITKSQGIELYFQASQPFEHHRKHKMHQKHKVFRTSVLQKQAITLGSLICFA